MEMEKFVHRWAVDISCWKPSSHDFSAVMSLLPQQDYPSITRFIKLEDCIRALVSRLLQYALVHQVLGIPLDDIIIQRTPEGKPFLVYDENMKLRFKKFNYSVSHHGDYVAIASEPICVVGLDIVSHSIPVNESADKFIRSFSSYFSSVEWNHILNAASSSDEMLKAFYRYWCLKEAFVKAIGSGVGYKLDDVEFHHENWDNIFVKVAGKELKDWKFWLLEFGQKHSVSIARGHPMTTIPNYSTTLKCMEFDDKECDLALHLPNTSFIFVRVEDLVRLWHCTDSVSSTLSRKPFFAAEGEIEKVEDEIEKVVPAPGVSMDADEM